MTVLRMPVGKGRHSRVAADDQGRAISALLLNPQGHIGTTIPLSGSVVSVVAVGARGYSKLIRRSRA
jgi:uncharacterized protein YbjT (DUF2867 family)